MSKSVAANKVLISLGGLLLTYALVGNYVALPGYLRFLERGGTSEAGNAFDLEVLIGATKTVLWMFSFQLGVLCLATAHSLRKNLHTRFIVVGGFVWLALWAWPVLPAPKPWFYMVLGSLLLASIGVGVSKEQAPSESRLGKSLLLGSLIFFAFATWEVCGLGTTGRMLHPEQASQPVAHNILITQSSKLMVEFVVAWVLLATSFLATRILRV